MKIKLSKSAMINWPRKDDKDKCDIYQFTEGEYSCELPEDVAQYVLENYEGKIIDVQKVEKKDTKKTLEEQVKEIKKEASKKEKEYQEQKAKEKKETEKNKGLKLEDLAKNA